MNTSSSNTITYIITVHGIGAQRDNETISPAVSRLVDVITDFDGTDKNSFPRNTLSLGQITGQEQANPSEHWAAFQNLSLSKLENGDKDFIFYGVEANPHNDPGLIRFCDIYWQDILQKHWGLVGESADTWVSAVVSRIFQNDSHPARLKSLMYTLEETVDLLYYGSKFSNKDKDLNKTIFEEYLGDVQIYTESHGCRADAIARFHERMDGLYSAAKDHTPRYIIIAHSLGTTMSLDALLDGARKNLPWMENIEAFVTLGSPIDKIITLWDFNYRDLDAPIPFGKKIASYNYSDEQDPVGYYLNEIVKKPAYQSVFEKKEDIVYNHSVVPGKAHIDYFTDIELFRHIVRKIIAPSAKTFDDVNMWFKGKVYTGVMIVTYFLIPLLIAGLNVLTLSLALSADAWQARVIASLVFALSSWLGKQVISLVISWRLAGNRGKDARPYSSVRKDNDALQKLRFKRGSNLLLWSIMIFSVAAPAALFVTNPWCFRLSLTLEKFWPFLVTTLGSFFVLFFLFMKKRKRQTLMRDMAGRVFTADLSTVLTIILSAAIFIAALATGGITFYDTLTKPATTVTATTSAQGEGALMYFSALMTCFTCFTYSSLRYFFEKGKIKRMKKVVAKAKKQ